MPKKPIKRGFKMYSLSCSCCGYLCNFSLFCGREIDSQSGRRLDKPKKISDTVKELLRGNFSGCNHVVYMDRFFTSGPLARDLRSVGIFTVGTVNRDSAGFPQRLKLSNPSPGCYYAERDSDITYYVYNDRRVVCFLSNCFPRETMPMYARPKGCHSGHLALTRTMPPVVPAYNKFMGGVDRTNQLCQRYLIDHRCHRPWMRIFFHLLQLGVSNAYILYKHNAEMAGSETLKTALAFRKELVELCLQGYCSRKRSCKAKLGAPIPGFVQRRDSPLVHTYRLVARA